MSADAARARARRASHVQRARNGSCAIKTARSVIASLTNVALIVDQRNCSVPEIAHTADGFQVLG